MIEYLLFAPFKLTGGKPVFLPGGNKILFLSLHRVRTSIPSNSCNAFLDISPDKLEILLLHLKSVGADFLSGKEFTNTEAPLQVHITLDDGYKDNLINALPLFEKHSIPFTLFLTTGIPDREAVLWWYLLEELFAKKLHLKIPQFNIDINAARIDKDKEADVFTFLRGFFLENYAAFKDMIDEALIKAGVDNAAFLEQHGLSWADVRKLCKSKLCTIGNHTHHHFCMSKLSPKAVLKEIGHAQQRIIKETGTTPRSLAFPFGAKEDIIDLSRLKGLRVPYAFSTETGIIRNFDKVNKLSIPRYFLNEQITPFSLNMMINGMRHRVNKLLY
ncbi:MAG TPA: polysaccharide deacetylase family protein [Flavipsychrobacter sp.]|nr:polysaccharide deacetylase family protein [Flavipsychrobacter sp.]